MAFQPAKGSKLDPSFLTNVIIANSQALNVGDVVFSFSTGFTAQASMAGGPVLGVIIGFEGSAGLQLTPTAYAKGTTAILPDLQSYTAASDNQTVAQVKAIVCADPFTRWSAAVNGTIGTTATSGQRGCRLDVDSSGSNYGRLLESTATRTASTVANFYSFGVDPDDSTRLIVAISSSELFNKQG